MNKQTMIGTKLNNRLTFGLVITSESLELPLNMNTGALFQHVAR